MAINKDELIRNYTNAIRGGNAAVFGGAGLSRASGFVDWKELIRPLAFDIGLSVDKENDYLSVAQFYRNKRSTRGGINQIIIDAFSKDVEINENISILTRLPINTYWTTNYDKLIENGLSQENRNPDVKYESNQLSVIKPDRDAIVYKMHGDVDHPADAVLTKEDYEIYDDKRPLFRTALKGDLISKVFLFIGFSFEDPNIDYVLSQIRINLKENIHDHYCFFRRVQRDDYENNEEYEYNLSKQDMQADDLSRYGVQTVFVNDYAEITDILKEIEHEYKTKNVFISGSACDFTHPWNQAMAYDFAEMLASELVKNDCRITSGFGLGIGSSVINGALNVIFSDKYRHVDEHLCLRPFPQNISDPTERDARWTKYREDMLEETGVSVFIFGNKEDKTTGNIVDADGCFEEYRIAKAKGNIIIPIGSTGYAAKAILEDVKKHITDYDYLKDYITDLETETDIDKLVSLVVKIINNQ